MTDLLFEQLGHLVRLPETV